MRTRLDNILLGILWLLAATLGTSFWFNTKYGFNIFSAPHWQYLAYLQASKTPVVPSFYISLGVCVFFTIFGLYFLIQPKLRKIVLPIIKTKKTNTLNAQQKSDAHTIAAPISAPAPAPVTESKQAVAPTTTARPTPMRPPHLNLPTTNSYSAAPMPTPTGTTSNNDSDNTAIREIFSNGGYVVKNNPYINGWKPNLLAIGTNEILWIGGIGATTKQVKNAINKLNQVFSDTLDDVYIGITGFSINAPDADTAEFNDILLFDTMDEISKYITAHPNPNPTPDEAENFDAYSEYIDTVIGYIGKL